MERSELDMEYVREEIRKYRERALKEIRGEVPLRERVNDPSKLAYAVQMAPERPVLRKVVGLEKRGEYYILVFRGLRLFMMKYLGAACKGALYVMGKDFGAHMVESGMVKSLDDLDRVFVEARIGLLDILNESENRMDINLYECMTCSGTPNIGETICYFEAGIIAGVLSKLIRPCKVTEKYCWGNGYSFCGFVVEYE